MAAAHGCGVFVRAWVLPWLLTASACATAPAEPWVLDSSDLTTSPTRRADWLDSYPRVLATILDVFERDLGLPRLQVRLVFLPDRPTLEQLLLEIGYTPELARDTAEHMVAVGGYRTMLLNERRLGERQWPDRLAVLAHELTHALQYELGGGVRGASDQWLREGYADWIEVRVLGVLGLVDEAATARRALETLRSTEQRARLPRLSALATFPSWVAQVRGQAGSAVYTQAQVAVAFLIERHGQDAVLRYFSLFATTQDRRGNFQAAFGEDLETFERAFRKEVWGASARGHERSSSGVLEFPSSNIPEFASHAKTRRSARVRGVSKSPRVGRRSRNGVGTRQHPLAPDSTR